MKEQLIWKIYIRILSTDYKIKQGKTNEDEPLRIEYIFASAHHFIVFKVKNNQKFSRANATAITCVLRTNSGINQLNFKGECASLESPSETQIKSRERNIPPRAVYCPRFAERALLSVREYN